jgi:pyruvate dehydrogenase E1 component alpha subunit
MTLEIAAGNVKTNGHLAAPPSSEQAVRQKQQDKERNLELYRQMLLIRRLEEKSAEAYTQGKIGGFLHLYIGEEAIAVGAGSVLRPRDHLVTHYRDHGYAIAKGSDPGAVMAELYGKDTGCSRGKGGSMHLSDIERHFWGGYAIVGGHLPLATGIAQSIQYQGKDEVVLCVTGEGSTNIGMFHESLNIAALWKLPIIYLVENNFYGMGTATSTHSSLTEIHQKGRAYGIPGDRFDGQDVWTVADHVGVAIERARNGGGPSLIEAVTYRFRGHSMADPQLYREKTEIEPWRKRDPLLVHTEKLKSLGIADEEDFRKIEALVEEQIAATMKFAEESPFPKPEALYADVYGNEYSR